MSAPTTPTSTHTYPSSSSSHPTRPFSPSPPRDNTYSSSRPPSLFLGASVPIASTSQPDFRAFDLSVSGIQESYDGIPRSERLSDEMFGLGGMRTRKDSRVGSIGEVDRTSVTGELDIPRDSLSMLRSRSDSISSASSASPPLGSTSILAALSATSSPPASRRQSRLSTGHTTPPHSALPSAPRSPQSARSPRVSLSHPSSIPNSRSMPRLHQPTVVRSTSGRGVAFLPPPSQPVAPDSTSLGRSRASRMSMPGQMGPIYPYTSDLDERGGERRYYSFREGLRPRPGTYMSDLGPPIRFPAPTSMPRTMPHRAEKTAVESPQLGDAIEMNKSDRAETNGEDINVGGPSTSNSLERDPGSWTPSDMDENESDGDAAEMVGITDQPEVTKVDLENSSRDVTHEKGVIEYVIDRAMDTSQTEGSRDEGEIHQEESVQGESVESVAGPVYRPSRAHWIGNDVHPTPQVDPAAEIDYLEGPRNQTLAKEVIEISPRLSDVEVSPEFSPNYATQLLETKPAAVGSVEGLMSYDVARSNGGDEENVGPSQGRLGTLKAVGKGKEKLAIPVSHDEPILNEISDEKEETDGTSLDVPLQCSIGDNANNSDLVVYIPPYKPRRPSTDRDYHISRLATLSRDDAFSITLLAAISRQSRLDPLTFTSPHLELYLSWAEPRSWTWLPARKYIPAKVDLRLVSSGKELILHDPDAVAKQQEAERRRGIGRNLVRAVVGRLPVVWRLAGWL